MGKRYGWGPSFIGDCDDCGCEHWGHYDEHEEEPLCPECVRWREKKFAAEEKLAAKALIKAEKEAAKAAAKAEKAAAKAAEKAEKVAAKAAAKVGGKRARGET